MKKPMLFGLLAAIAALGLLFAVIRSALPGADRPGPAALDNLAVTIDGETFTLTDGVAENQTAPGSATANTLRIVGEPATGDITGDGNPDAALLVRHDPGGSGTFYYAVVAVDENGSYRATNAVPLGDRITPGKVAFTDGAFTYTFTDRTPGQSMADTPAVETSVAIVFDSATGTILPAQVFPKADWLWKPIGSDPALAAESRTWVSYLSEPDTEHVAELYREGTTLIPAAAVNDGTPRYDVRFTEPWGPDPFGTLTVPIPRGTQVPQYPGGDGHLAIQDPETGQVFGLWQARYDPKSDTWEASWGGMSPITGDGIDSSGSATAANLSRYAGVVTAAQMATAIAAGTGLGHALVFATDIAGPDFVAPATKSDGTNEAGVATPIPEGYRVQLDPSIDVEAIPGITPGEKVIARTLQTHGAYVIDKGSARMAFAFEALPEATDANPGKSWIDAGFKWDYYDMDRIPWVKLRVLAPS